MLRVSAQISLILVWHVTWAAPISWMLVFDCAKQGSIPSAFWSSESNSALDLSSALGLWTSYPRTDSFLRYLYIGCSCWIIWWWNCNFKSTFVKNFHDLNFNDWSNNCSSRNCCKDSGSWVYSGKCILSAQWNDLPKTVVLVRSGFVAHTSWNPMHERYAFANPSESNCFGQWFEVLNVFPHTVSKCQSWRRCQKFLLLVILHLTTHTFGHGFPLSRMFFLSLIFLCQTELLTPIRNFSVDTEPIYRDWRQELCVWSIRKEVYGVSVILLVEDSTTQSTDTLEYWMTVSLNRVESHFPSCV